MADDLGYGDLSCYGQKKFTTPNLDKMAKEGLRFTQYYAGNTVCAPSRCALLTGKHMGHAYIRGNSGGSPDTAFRPEDVIVSEILKKAGYATGVFGKWGMGFNDSTGQPNKKGVDEFFGVLGHKEAHKHNIGTLYRNNEELKFEKPVYSHDLIVKEGLEFVRKHKDEPFFLYLPFMIPHAGLEVPEDSFREFAGKFPDKPWSAEKSNYAPVKEPKAAFAAMITRMDRDIGTLLALLKELNIDENTIVFFTSDNGPHREGGADPDFFNSSGGLRGIKRDLYEGGIRVPMIVRWPGKGKRGTSDHVWAHWDVLPTLAELAGAEAPRDIDGISMLAAIRGKKAKEHEYLYWEFTERGFQQAVRMDDWKAVKVKADEPLELYNLKKDIAETRNVAAENPKVVAKIETILASARTESTRWPSTKKKAQ